jgi:hypothetical protein
MPNVTHQIQVKPGFAVCGYFDVLGQAEALSLFIQKDLRPTNPGLKQEIEELLKPIQQFRFYSRELSYQDRIAPAILNSIPAEFRDRYQQLSQSSRKETYFSDACFVLQPLWQPYSASEPLTMLHFLLYSALCYITCSAEAIPLRGGVQLGFALEVTEESDQDGHIYGPVLAQSYQLESKLADFPRIIVGTDLLKHCKALSERSGLDADSVDTSLYRLVRSFVTDGDDGLPELSLSCPLVIQTIRENGFDPMDLLQKAKAAANDARDRAAKQGNHKVYAKYVRQAYYFERHLLRLKEDGSGS